MRYSDDWRLFKHQGAYLYGVKLIYNQYVPYRTDWDHDHCEFCMDKFGLEKMSLHYGYCTEDHRFWICPNCFHDFKDMFDWKVINQND